MNDFSPNQIADQCGELIKWALSILVSTHPKAYSATRKPGRAQRETLATAAAALTDALLRWQRAERLPEYAQQCAGVVGSFADLLAAARAVHTLRDADLLRNLFDLEKAKWQRDVGEPMPRMMWAGSRRILKHKMLLGEETRWGFAFDPETTEHTPAFIAALTASIEARHAAALPASD